MEEANNVKKQLPFLYRHGGISGEKAGIQRDKIHAHHPCWTLTTSPKRSWKN